MHVHLVFVTKYRHSVLADRHLTRCEEIMRAVYENFEAELVEFNGENHHVHTAEVEAALRFASPPG
ncbi:transposase [Streptomyces sp. NPDC059718]